MQKFMYYTDEEFNEKTKKQLVMRSIIERLYYQFKNALDEGNYDKASEISKKAHNIVAKHLKDGLLKEIRLTTYGMEKLIYYYQNRVA